MRSVLESAAVFCSSFPQTFMSRLNCSGLRGRLFHVVIRIIGCSPCPHGARVNPASATLLRDDPNCNWEVQVLGITSGWAWETGIGAPHRRTPHPVPAGIRRSGAPGSVG